MVIISRFRLLYKKEKDAYKVISYDEKTCPYCKGRLKCIGCRKRSAIFSDGIRMKLIIRKLRCSICGKTHSELPNILVPYHTICKDTIEKVLSGKLDTAPVDYGAAARLVRWWKMFQTITKIRYICQIEEKVNKGEILHTHFRHIKEQILDTITLSSRKEEHVDVSKR